ncbi:unnamed protein product, partial [Musa banksii]
TVLVTVSKSYIWAYASFQFAIVILFAHIFYNVVRLFSQLNLAIKIFDGGLGGIYVWHSNKVTIGSSKNPETYPKLKMEVMLGSMNQRTRSRILTLLNKDEIIYHTFEVPIH